MKDLYKRLAIAPSASEDEIRRALPAAEEPARTEGEFILLQPDRRAVYDRNHRVLSTIGQLRGRLALGLRPFWSHGDHKDFTQLFSTGRTDLRGIGENDPSDYSRTRRSRKWVWWLLAIGIALAAGAWYAHRQRWVY